MKVKGKIVQILVDGESMKHFLIDTEHGSMKIAMYSEDFSGKLWGTYQFILFFTTKSKKVGTVEYTSQRIIGKSMSEL